jgi:hypothetical protein
MFRFRWTAAVLAAALAATFAVAQDIALSDAEKRLFTADHLGALPTKATLRYEFAKSGTLEKSFRDDVVISVGKSESKADGRHVAVKFLTGENKVELPELDDAKGNPVIMYFLEHDVREMQRITRGQSNYYRRRIRIALSDHATVRPVNFDYAGRSVPGTVIEVDPYQDDPVRKRFEKYANKRYSFTLSGEVPGGVYQMRTVMANAGAEPASGESPVMIEEVLTLKGMDK